MDGDRFYIIEDDRLRPAGCTLEEMRKMECDDCLQGWAAHFTNARVPWHVCLGGQTYYKEGSAWWADSEVGYILIRPDDAKTLDALVETEASAHNPCRYCSGDDRAYCCECL